MNCPPELLMRNVAIYRMRFSLKSGETAQKLDQMKGSG